MRGGMGWGGDTGGTSEGFYGKIAIKLVERTVFSYSCASADH